MLFFNSKVLLYVRKNKLEVFLNGKHDEVEFPPKVFQNLEILDFAGFEKLVSDFLAGLNLGKKQAVIALSDEITFHKVVPAAMTQAFLDSVPFDPQNIAVKKLQSGDQIFIYATNKEVYETLLRIADDFGLKILAVIPAAVFKEKLGLTDDVLDSGIAKRILSDKKLITLSDFLSDEGGEIEKPKKGGSPLRLLAVLIFVLVIISGLMFEAVKLGVVKNPLPYLKNLTEERSKKTPEKAPVQESTSSASKVSTDSASLQGETLERSGIKIQVLNGSRIAGQAGKVKDQLAALGYEDIETGNAVGTATQATTVIFSKKVPEEAKKEIISELENTFDKVTTQGDTENSDFNVIITTGKTTSP